MNIWPLLVPLLKPITKLFRRNPDMWNLHKVWHQRNEKTVLIKENIPWRVAEKISREHNLNVDESELNEGEPVILKWNGNYRQAYKNSDGCIKTHIMFHDDMDCTTNTSMLMFINPTQNASYDSKRRA